jgi:arsenate reductase-like glutaredoxin family protein
MDYQQRIDELEKQQREMLKRLEELERQTEPIKITRLEIDPGGMQELLVQANNRLERIIQTQTDRSEKLDTLTHGQQELKQELYTLSNNWLDTLQKKR